MDTNKDLNREWTRMDANKDSNRDDSYQNSEALLEPRSGEIFVAQGESASPGCAN